MVESEVLSEERRRSRGARDVGSLLGDALSRVDAEGDVGRIASAWRVWYRVNGIVEREHTQGIYVARPKREGCLPELVVYVDSHAYLTDFSANSEVYLARLDSAGLRFSKVTFRLSKRPTRTSGRETSYGASERTLSPQLSDEELSEIEQRCEGLPQRLRESVSQAMRNSYQSQKREHS